MGARAERHEEEDGQPSAAEPARARADGGGGERDWGLVRRAKEAYWRSLGPAERLRLCDELRRHALLLHPDWPTEAERTADYEAHVRFCERLEHAASTRKR